ncbi:MAG TPA: hypothetical protein HA252_05675 [Candidatus Diapherotrites archaeon]|uniref:Uncharacterized protein n=1 Tax=Candidatus Iainarchaeum sp. TaxID=3101447 RepID=A0A7J4JNS2_9ARCH|nr:hypothetical protein [Candidatus Diapherotrites archaeon]HIH16866.1 hypothetical protein [Candidatus Diapherotrites archaeon]
MLSHKTVLALALLVLLASSALAQTYNYYNQPTVIPGQQTSRISQADIEKALREIARVYGQVQGRFIAEQQTGYQLPTVAQGQPSLAGQLQKYLPQPTAAAQGQQANPFLTYGFQQDVTDLFSRDFVRQQQGENPLYSLPQYKQDPQAQAAYQQAQLPDYREVRLVELRERSVLQGNMEFFDVEIRNTNFMPRAYALHVEKEDASLKTSLSESAFSLAPGEARTVKAIVEPTKETKPGAKAVYVVVTSSPTTSAPTGTGLGQPSYYGQEYDYGGASALASAAASALPAPVMGLQRLVVSLEDFQKPVKAETVVLKVNRQEYDVGAKGFDVQVSPNKVGGSDKVEVSIAEDFFVGSQPAVVEVLFMDAFDNAYSLSFELVPSKYEVQARNLEFKAQVFKALQYGRELRNAYFRARASTGKYVKNNAYQLQGPRAFVKLEETIPVGSKNNFEFYAEDQFGTYFKTVGSFTIRFLVAPQGMGLPEQGYREYGNKQEYREPLTLSVVEKPVLADVLQITAYPAEISLKGGESRAFEVSVLNAGTEPARDLDLALRGLPQGVEFTASQVDELPAGKSAVFKATLATGLDVEKSFSLELEANGLGLIAAGKALTLKLEPKPRVSEQNLVSEVVERELSKTTVKSKVSDEQIKAEVEKMISALQSEGLKKESAEKIRELIPVDFAVKANILNAEGEKVDALYGIKKGKDLFVTRVYDGIVNSEVNLDYDTLNRLAVENMVGSFGQAGLVGFGVSDQGVAVGLVILVIGLVAVILLFREKHSSNEKFLRKRNFAVIKAKNH